MFGGECRKVPGTFGPLEWIINAEPGAIVYSFGIHIWEHKASDISYRMVLRSQGISLVEDSASLPGILINGALGVVNRARGSPVFGLRGQGGDVSRKRCLARP